MLEYGRFKYVLILLALVLSVVYALPNVYPQDPSVQVTANRGYKVDATLRQQVEQALSKAGRGAITTEIEPAGPYYFAEDYHQGYLAKNPAGYCGIGGTGVVCPIGVGVEA